MRPFLLLPFLLIGIPSAEAQTAPACTPEREGMVACFGDRLCECRLERGGTVSGRRAGFHWDCGILRPSCGVVPPGPPPQPLPEGTGILMNPPYGYGNQRR